MQSQTANRFCFGRQWQFTLHSGQPSRRRTDVAGYPNIVPHLSAAAPQGRTTGQLADNRDIKHPITARGITANQRNAVPLSFSK